MKSLNKLNGADAILYDVVERCLREFKEDLNIVIMGTAYGGEVEDIAEKIKGRGKVWGYDTFEDLHPSYLFKGPAELAFEATCMDHWYKEEIYGTDELAYNYQRNKLDEKGLDNAILIKEVVTDKTKLPVKKIHLGFMDMDMLESMQAGYSVMKRKIVKGGYFAFHDLVPPDHIPRLYNYFMPLFENSKTWEIITRHDPSFMVVLKKK